MDVRPGEFGLSGDIGGQLSVLRQSRRAGRVEPAQVRRGFDRVAIGADLPGNAYVDFFVRRHRVSSMLIR